MSKPRRKLRSRAWFDDPVHPVETAIYIERYLNYGLTPDELRSGRPIIGIAQTGSDLAPCNRHHLTLAARVRDGIRDAGGVPFEFPVHAIHEMGKRPTAALDRNLAYLGLVEILYGYPLDGVVLTTGCDKTTPACLMAAAAVDIPAIVLSGGPMLNGWIGDTRIGSGSIIWQARDRMKAGEIDFDTFMNEVLASSPSVGHCNTMGTALTMNCLAEALGMSLAGCAAIPAAYRERSQMAHATGRRIVELVHQDLRPSAILTSAAFRNAIRVCAAIGGSTNATIHVQAIADAAGVPLDLEEWGRCGAEAPLLVNCQPSGEYLGEDFYRAGGVPAVLGELCDAGIIEEDTPTVSGRSLGELYAAHASSNHHVIRTVANPIRRDAGFLILASNIFRTAVFKSSVLSETFRRRYLQHPDRPGVFTGRTIVFDGPEDYHERIDDPTLAIDEDCILVMRGCGPMGYPGSAEVVNMAPPDYLISRGIEILPCIGDGRQSGTSASPSILHVTPESATGDGLALVETGDLMCIDLTRKRVDLLVDAQELRGRRTRAKAAHRPNETPWQEIYRAYVRPLDEGAGLATKQSYHRIDATFGPPRHSH